MPLQATSGAASYDAFGGGGAAVEPVYIEQIFSTYLYTGTGAALTITNNIDLSTKGGLVWTKGRITGYSHNLVDTARGTGSGLASQSTGAQNAITASKITSFNTAGYSMSAGGDVNVSAETFVSWTFRKQPKFFDIVTYTGDGSASRNIGHALGSKPGFVVLKRTDSTGNWFVAAWTGTTFRIGTDALPFALNSTNAYNTQNGAAATSTTFDPNEVTLSSNYGVTPSNANINGATYVAYLFAHDAGGFGLTGTDNVISCASFTTDASGNATVNLGYEPQWLMFKASSGAGSWFMYDNMRGFGVTSALNNYLLANSSGTENNGGSIPLVTSTGFSVTAAASTTYIYIAIRRGPMKVPTDGTKVYNATTGAAYSNPETVSVGFPPDLVGINNRGAATGHYFVDRLRGGPKYFTSTSTAAEADDGANKVTFDTQNSATVGGIFGAPYNGLFWFFRRAPSFFDEVCYTGTGSATTFSHNLAAVPELMIVKKRSAVDNWIVYHKDSGNSYYLSLNTTSAKALRTNVWNATTPTASVFSLGDFGPVNDVSATYVAYLFATCAGVSKVGSYTGTATTLQIDCGFTAGARFVLIKRTDSTGDWYVWDTARGIVSGNDPYLLLNSAAAEVTSTDYVDTANSGFEISSTAPAAINANGGSFIFLAIS